MRYLELIKARFKYSTPCCRKLELFLISRFQNDCGIPDKTQGLSERDHAKVTRKSENLVRSLSVTAFFKTRPGGKNEIIRLLRYTVNQKQRFNAIHRGMSEIFGFKMHVTKRF